MCTSEGVHTKVRGKYATFLSLHQTGIATDFTSYKTIFKNFKLALLY